MIFSIYLLPAEVWGTVSDWFMVAVTSVTAFYLYKTLRSQQEVQKTQNELFTIENIRFKESIKPILKYTGTTQMMHPGDETKKILTVEVSNETSSNALNISKIVSEKDQIFIPMGFSDTRTHLVKGDAPLLFHFLIDPKGGGFVSFSLSYQDIAGTKYKQGVFCICDEIGIELHPYLPKVLD
ncbi:hypothetical protein [Mucilaginibacter panaciglaebae]|uniref:Uncharacterized protein n=1 Tax=Mucilaginibacter panaciglaebae TaxID=502331 RepID=A0ABP7WZ80_9SPHI